MTLKDIQESIKIIRSILGYTQTQLADILGVSRVYLGSIESGKVELQQTLAIAFITVVIAISRELDRETMTYKVINVYVEEFENIVRKMIYLHEGL